jgi:hypothetical protein
LKKHTHIKLKAAFLVIVFGLNSVVSLACSIGVDMGYNSKHHDKKEETEAVVHIHKDGKKHIHYEKKKHDDHEKPHHKNEGQSNSSKDNCCSGEVKQFSALDKSLPNTLNLVHPVFALSFVAVFYDITLAKPNEITRDIKQFVRSYHPPIPDIRIAIQSFQI